MFDPKAIEAYRKISAPDDLRDKVLSSCANSTPKSKSPMIYMKWITTAAACFVLVALFSVFAANDFGDFSVSTLAGELPRTRSVAYEPDHSIEGYSTIGDENEMVISLLLDGRASLSVSDGVIYAVDPETEELIMSGTEYSLRKETLVHWTVCADDTAQTFEMTVRGLFKTEKLLLAYDASEMKWMLTRTDEK